MFKKLAIVRWSLFIGLIFSILYAGWGIYYKQNFLNFTWTVDKKTPVWTIEAHLKFQPKDENVKVVFARPTIDGTFKILNENTIAKGNYTVQKSKEKIELTARGLKKIQNVYYRILLYDTVGGKNVVKDEKTPKVIAPLFDDDTLLVAKELLQIAKLQPGDPVQQIISLLNNDEESELVHSFLPKRTKPKEKAEKIVDLLALENIPARMIRGVHLIEGKKSVTADVMIEIYSLAEMKWVIYNIETGQTGLPKDFIVFQKGNASLVDVIGGGDSSIKYSVLKSLNSSFSMAKHRAKNTGVEDFFAYSIYNLPIDQQNALKWLMVFPLAILVVVILRNVVGIKTMGTFTPMLISMALVETGFLKGLICFSIIVGVGLLIRLCLSRLNLLLVPRISAVVVFVVLLIQTFTILGYKFDWHIASSALFFPIIIVAWVIERGSIIWEEEGFKNAFKEVFFSLLSAVIIYFVIVNETIRHITFAFNELNIVILFLIMLLGTYTGYRITELKRFAPLVRKKDMKKTVKRGKNV